MAGRQKKVTEAPEAPIENQGADVTVALELKVKKLNKDAVVPESKTEDSAGLDLTCIATTTLFPRRQQAYTIPLGIALEIPKGYHGKIFLRSSIGLNTGIRLANGTGIIDADYRGEVKLIVENTGLYPVNVTKGERLAQLIVEKNVDIKVTEVKELSETKRGAKGIGSTGK